MVSKVAFKSFDQRVLKEGKGHQAGKYLSAKWMVLVAGAILAWISLMPVAWIGWQLAQKTLFYEALMLAACGLLAFFWNLFHLQRLLFDLYQEEHLKKEMSKNGVQITGIFGVQLLLAFACTHLAGSFNPIGMQQWLWMPVAGFAGVLLTRRRHMVLVLCITLAVSTAREYAMRGLNPAAFGCVASSPPVCSSWAVVLR